MTRGFNIVGIVAVVCAIGAISAGVLLFWKHYTGLLTDKATAEQLYTDAHQALAEQGEELERARVDRESLERIHEDRELERRRIENEREDLDAELTAMQTIPEVRAWLDGGIPDPLLERLRGHAAGAGHSDRDKAGIPAAQPAPADAGAGVPRPPQ